MRAELFAAFILITGTAAAASAHSAPAMPKITGISHLAVYTSDPAATENFYTRTIGAAREADPEDPQGVRYVVSPTQFIEVLPLPPGAGIQRLDHTAWNTESAEGMSRYLAARGWKTPDKVERGSDGSRWFEVLDPEGNKVQFVQPPPHPRAVKALHAIGHHLIHVGFLVHDRAREDTFYRNLLGFRPYWYGGMQEGVTDWVSQQVPDGRDWLEYMLVHEAGSGVPGNMTQNRLGVMDHVSIGVASVPETFKVLQAADRLGGRHDPSPKIGRDGKYQLNLYDPDGIRVEIMNFHATGKPCCSPFTAPDPAN